MNGHGPQRRYCKKPERNRVIVDTALDAVISMDAGASLPIGMPRPSTSSDGNRRKRSVAVYRKRFPARPGPAHERGLRHFLESGQGALLNRRIEMMGNHRDGLPKFPVEITISPARLGDAYIFSAFIRDITARKRTERQLASQYAVTPRVGRITDVGGSRSKILQAICESLEWELGIFWQLDRQNSVLRCLDVWQSPGLNAEEFVLETWQHTFRSARGFQDGFGEAGGAHLDQDVVQEANFPSRRSLPGRVAWCVWISCAEVGTEVGASSSCSGAKSNSRMNSC